MSRSGSPTPPSRITLGPFALEACIGEGGMGEVWRARHVSQRVAVAVKVLTAQGSERPMFVESFRNEVRAVAALDHPSIVRVLDYGSVSEHAAVRSGGHLVAGTPYLSMELVQGDTLADHKGRLPWTEIERILRCLLDALAHAHARGVVHRDLKLSNVLYDPSTGAVKLTDFGIAHAVAATGDPFRWGTPAYMPPEQLLGRWWDYGPWTDLYSLGCCAVALVTGARAFPNEMKNPESRRLPPLAPRMMVPSGLEPWLRTLTDPDPQARFPLAADAAWALSQIRGTGRAPVEVPGDTEEEAAFPEVTVALPFAPGGGGAYAGRTPSPLHEETPPMPEHWASTQAPPPTSPLHGAGLGLVRLRRVPLVGREAERTSLWRALREVRETREARVVVVRGAAGVGKSRLAVWLGERAHEVGAAWVLRVQHTPRDPGDRALGAMVARHLRLGGLGSAQIHQRIAAAMPDDASDDEISGLVALVDPDARRAKSLPTAEDRARVLARFVEHHAGQRPVVLLADDVQWGATTLRFVALLSAPVLAVLCASEEGLAERLSERERLTSMLTQPQATAVRLGPLPPHDHRELVHALLGLDSTLTRLVEDRTAGNPLFAVQLVGDWVERQVLEPGPHGFALRDGVEAPLPDDLYAVWAERIDDVLADRDPADRPALEIAALLGQRVSRDEWVGACRARGFQPTDDLVEALLSRRLASLDEGTPGSWWFAHAMLRESLERQAEEAGRAPSHHRACVAMLEASGRPAHARLARHLLHADAPERAVAPAVAAVLEACDAGHYDRAETLLDLWTQAMTSLVLRQGHPCWIEGLAASAQVYLHKGRVDDVHGVCEQLERGVDREGWPEQWLAFTGLCRGVLARRDGRLVDAADHLERALESDPQPAVRVALLGQRGRTLLWMGAVTGAAASFRACLDAAAPLAPAAGIGDAHIGLAEVARFGGDLTDAREHAGLARDAYQEAGFSAGPARVSEVMAGVARNEGDWEEAQAMARAASQQWSARGTPVRALGAEVGEVVARMHAGESLSADELEPLVVRARRLGAGALVAVLGIAQAAGSSRRSTCHARLKEARKWLDQSQLVTPDVARAAELVARRARRQQWKAAARHASALAVAQWMRLGRLGDADRVRKDADSSG